MTNRAAPAPSHDFKVFKPGEVLPSKGITIYGKGGVGKTALLGTMPGRGLVIDFPSREGGTEVLGTFSDRIDVFTVNEWNDVETVCWKLETPDHGYTWVGIDSITAAQKYADYKIAGKGDLTKKREMTGSQMGDSGALVGEFIFRMRSINIWSIWIGLQRRRGNDEDASADKLWGPAVYPGVIDSLVPSMKIVARMLIERNNENKVERRLILGPVPNMITKVRAPLNIEIPYAIRNPNLGQLLLYLGGRDVKLDVVEDDAILPMEELDTTLDPAFV